MRWIESPAAAGLRFVGFADEISKAQHSRAVDHTGWYLNEFQDESVRGAVWQMEARNGAPRFVAGYDDPYNGRADSDGAACISFDEIFTGERGDDESPNHSGAAMEAAIRADGIAESMAETEREYQAASSAGFEYSELAGEISATRRQTIQLIRELKTAAKLISADSVRASCAALRATIKRNLDEIKEAREKRRELFDEFGSHDGFANA